MKKSISKPDFSKAFKIFLSFSTLSLTISGITLIGIKNRDKTDQINIPITHSAQETEELLDKINYLSLGDSISAGFNWDYSFDVRGMLDENNQVKGLSYPAFFANFIQKINPNALKSFDNLALSWTTVTDWLYLLNPENEKYKNSDKTHFRFNYHLDKKLHSPYGQQIREVFDDFSATSFPKLHKKIQDSNLITLSLGANDLIESIDFRVIAKPLQKLATKAEASFEFMQNIELAYQKIYRNLLALVENLRKINPNVRIVLVGYNSLTSNIVKFFEKLLTNEIGLPENYANLAIKRLNSTIKQVAKVQKVQYVDLYNEKIWQENPTEFASKELDIHPSTKGYKKMAQDLLFKLAFEQDVIFKNEAAQKLGWDKDYIEKDLNNYRRILNLGPNSKILEALSFEGSTDKFISETSQIEQTTTADIQKTEKSPIENFVNVILNNNFGDFLSRFVQLGLQNNPGVQKILTDFWKENQKAGASFAQILQKIFSSGFFSQIISRFQTYVQNIINTQDWEKATISDLVNQIFADFDEKQIIDVLNTVVTSEFASENPEKTKELIFASIFGQSLVQDLIINNIIKLDVAYKDNLKVVFTFDSIRKLFTKIITDFQLRTKDYENSATFQQIIQTYLENPQNDADNVSFIRNFISETLKHHDSVKVLVGIINDNFNFNLSKDDQDSLTDLLVSLADVIVRTNVWAKLNDIAAKNFLEVIKKSDYKNIESISSIFADQIYTNYTSFFKDSKNLLDLFHELLSFELSNNQIESLKKLLNKFYPILTKFDLSNFIDTSSPNYASFSFLFDSVKDFLVSNSFKPLSDIVNSAINDFLINKSQYKRIDDLNRFGFQFLANNLPKLEENIYDFIAKNVQNENFLNSLIGLISNSLSDQGLKPTSVKTFSEIIRLIFEDFYAKYQVWKEDKTSPTNNLIFEFVNGAINTFETFTKSNFAQYDSLKTNLESAKKAENEPEIQEYSAKIALLDQQLSFQNFSSYFLNNFFSQEQIYSLLKSLASLDFRSKITNHDLVLFFKNLFDQSFLHKQLIEKLNQNNFFNKEKIQQPLLNILSSFFESSEVEELLSKLIDYFFDDKKFEEHPDFSSLIQNFITENSQLIEKVFTLFLGNTTTWESISEFLRAILDEYKLNLSQDSVNTILELVRDILAKLRDLILSVQNETTIQPPLTIKSIITIIVDAISNNPTPNKSVIETLFDSFSVDIANNYYSPEATSKQDPSKITPDKISSLIAEVMKTEPISEQIKSSLSSIPDGYREDIVPIFNSFLQSDGLKDLFNSYFKIVAKANINKPLDNLSLIKSLFERQYFNKIIGEFIVKLDEKKNNLTTNFAKLSEKIFNTKFEETEFESFFKLIKKIIQNNIDSYYANEPESVDIFSDQPQQINVSQNIANLQIIAQPFSDSGTEEQSPTSSSTGTENQTSVKKDANYSKENAFLTKLIDILSKLTNGQFSTSNLNSLLESEIGNEAFIVDLVKQIASVYDQIDKSEKNNIWNILTKIFKSDFFKEKIELLSVGNISSFSIFSGLSKESKEKVEPTFKSLLLDFLPNSANKLFIFRILDHINKNQQSFKDVKTFSGILTKFLSDDKSNKNTVQGQSSQTQTNREFLKAYLWHVLDFLVKHDKFLDIAVDVIASYLKLNLDSSNPSLSKFNVQNPREIPKAFLKEFIGLGFDNPLISDILDQMLDAVKTLDSSKEASTFFSAIFSKLDFAKLINLDLVVKIEPKISANDSTGQTPTDPKVLIDEEHLTLKTPTGQKISPKSLADFFDLVFLASPNWDKTKENETSPILKELNHIPFTGISFKDLFSSNKKDPQLEAISKLFHRIWYSESAGSSKISFSNFKQTSKGRLLYRLTLILLFYTYESRISKLTEVVRKWAFYGGVFSSSTASEIIRASLHSGQQSDKSKTTDNNYKTFIDQIIGNPVKHKGWFSNTYYTPSDVNLNDMITMIYYNADRNRFSHVTKQEKLKDQILQQIRDGTYPDNYR